MLIAIITNSYCHILIAIPGPGRLLFFEARLRIPYERGSNNSNMYSMV